MAKKKITLESIDKDKFEATVHLGLSTEEICDFFMINTSQLWSWIKQAYNTRSPMVTLKKIRVEGKMEFLASQRRLAQKNPAMAIWFGKNYYDQTDGKEEAEFHDFEDLSPLVELLKEDTEDGNSDN